MWFLLERFPLPLGARDVQSVIILNDTFGGSKNLVPYGSRTIYNSDFRQHYSSKEKCNEIPYTAK